MTAHGVVPPFPQLAWGDAVRALAEALADGTAPGRTPQRSVVEVSAGQLLLMPTELGGYVGVKVASVRTAPADAPRIQGGYLLMDAATLSPLAVYDAAALTLCRTAAVSALAASRLATADASRLVVFGQGPQARAHEQALRAVLPIDDVTTVGRDRVGLERLGDADVVACCTTAREPLFDSALLPAHSTVVAIGSHEPTAREVDTDLVRRATVVVESRGSALAEAGDVLLAIADGVVEEVAVNGDLAELVRGEVKVAEDGPRLFKSVGEAWEDLVIAAAAYSRA